MKPYYIACFFSALSAICTVISSWILDKRRSFLLQMLQCLLYAVASWFFGVRSAVITVLFCALRNYLVAKDRFGRKICLILSAFLLIFGALVNNSGIIGWLPIITTLLYNLGCCLLESLRAIKWNMLVNLLLWALYDAFIADYISMSVDLVGAVAGALALIRLNRLIRRGMVRKDIKPLKR